MVPLYTFITFIICIWFVSSHIISQLLWLPWLQCLVACQVASSASEAKVEADVKADDAQADGDGRNRGFDTSRWNLTWIWFKWSLSFLITDHKFIDICTFWYLMLRLFPFEVLQPSSGCLLWHKETRRDTLDLKIKSARSMPWCRLQNHTCSYFMNRTSTLCFELDTTHRLSLLWTLPERNKEGVSTKLDSMTWPM